MIKTGKKDDGQRERLLKRVGDRFAAVSISLVCGLALFACGPVDITEYEPLIEPPSAFLENTNLRIEALDGSFVIEGGEPFEPPFYTHLTHPHCPKSNSFNDATTIVDGYTAALDCGAKEVQVFVDGDDRPLYGVLALGRLFPSAKGSVKRSYLLSIPPEKISNLSAGSGVATTVTYEKYYWEQQWSDGTKNRFHWRAWILWLSKTPLR